MYYVGIDPGKNGGFALISERGVEVHVYSDEGFVDICRSLTGEKVRCCLEQVHAMPGQGSKSTFNFGANYGFIRGVLESRGISYQEVSPQKWKSEFGLSKDKARSIAVCKRLFPDVKLRKTDRCRVDHDGMAEALLMAEYARRKL